jgi:uncharacterized protein (DUF2062 family)
MREVLRRRFIHSLLDLLRLGATPQRIAWSLAVGVAIGINPLLGSTTILCLLLCLVFRLNLVTSQLANYAVYPLQLLLFLVFIRIGNLLFHTASLPLRQQEILAAASHHPWATTRLLWSWEWHALIVWLLVTPILVPLLAAILTPLLKRLARSVLPDSPPARGAVTS